MKYILKVMILSILLPVFASEHFEEEKTSSPAYSKVTETKVSPDASVPWRYSLGRLFWTGLHALIHSQNNTTNAQLSQPTQGDELVTLKTMDPALPVDNIWIARTVPQEEDSFAAKYLPNFLGFLRDHLLYIPSDLPQIPDDHRKVAALIPSLYKKYVPAFEHIPEFVRGSKRGDILGEMVLKGASGAYIEKVEGSDGNLYKVDLSCYNQFQPKDGLSRLGGIAWLRYNNGTMETESISYTNECIDKDSDYASKAHLYKKTDISPEEWNHKQRIMLATMLNDIGVGRHAADIHLIMAGTFSSVNNNLPIEHPMRKLMYLHQFQSISLVHYKPVLLLKDGGYFPCFSSYNRDVLMEMIVKRAEKFDIARMDVKADLNKRKMFEWGGSSKYPYADNAMRLWAIISNHVNEYISLYYQTDDEVVKDEYLQQWFEGLNKSIPNGIKGYTPTLTKENLTKLITSFIFTTSVEHDLVANFQLNYTIWQNVIPLQVPVDINQRPSIDVLNQYMDLIIAIVSPTIRMASGSFANVIKEHRARANIASFRKKLLEYDSQLNRSKQPGDEYHLIFPSQLDAAAST